MHKSFSQNDLLHGSDALVVRWILLAACLLLPAAQALELQAPAEIRLQPETAAPLDVVALLDCMDFADAGPGAELVLTATASHPGLRADTGGPVSIDWAPCLTGATRIELPVEVILVGQSDVPAEEPYAITFTGSAGNVEASNSTNVEMVYEGRVEATAASPHRMAAPQKQIRFPIELQNHANGRTLVRFEAVQPKEGHLISPTPVVLEAAGQEGSRATVEALYATPFDNGYVTAKEALVVTMTAVSAKTEAPAGQPFQIELTAETKGWYIPGPGVLLLPGLLGAAALRRSRGPGFDRGD